VYDVATEYCSRATSSGNITIRVGMVRQIIGGACRIFPAELEAQLIHLNSCRTTVRAKKDRRLNHDRRAFILPRPDDLDATIHQVPSPHRG
jgi:hypothetical protein